MALENRIKYQDYNRKRFDQLRKKIKIPYHFSVSRRTSQQLRPKSLIIVFSQGGDVWKMRSLVVYS